eukprot:TRINITY_DN44038_c0_g1_i1.p2 TRINITY_DN44038_c0_g1~~TRINITY_DN44038_c0_g1_i1.p2  ORF type:complete len:247 (+),score=55.95 TRINITY_DN44038_c0_g1_i1:197-937(+)
MGGNCSKDQDGVAFNRTTVNGLPLPSKPLVPVSIGTLLPFSGKAEVVIPSGAKNALVLHCAERGETTGSTALAFPLNPPFKHAERRNLVSGDVEICVEFSLAAAQMGTTAPPSGPSNAGFVVFVAAVVCYGWQLAASPNPPLSVEFLLEFLCGLLFVAAWLIGSKQANTVPHPGAGDNNAFSVRVIGSNGRALQLEAKPVAPPVSASGLWVVPDLSLIHISEPTRLLSISYAVFCLKKKKNATSIT